jgi:glyoxylase I family protein
VQVAGIHHQSVVVTDLERARRFYRDVLGLTEVPTPPTFYGTVGPVVWFAVGPQQQIHLLPARRADPPSPRHVALQVTDAAAARQELAARGCAVEETTPIPGADRFFTADPDGNRIEVIQWQIPWADTVRRLGLTLGGSTC